MNFYKHHLGDYAAATSHLSWDEDCAYRRLIDQYYKREAPLPTDLREVCRLVRATSAAQRKAVQTVLDEFFRLSDDGWRQKRCDVEIAAANAQADTNRRIAEQREANRRARHGHESLNESCTTGSPAHMVGREPSQTPDSTSQTPLPEPIGSGEAARPPRATRKCPESFVVTEAMLAWADEHCPGALVGSETDKFRDHTFKTAISDWPAAWRNWLRKSVEFRSGGAQQPTFRERDEQRAIARVHEMTGGLVSAKPVAPVRDVLQEVFDAPRRLG